MSDDRSIGPEQPPCECSPFINHSGPGASFILLSSRPSKGSVGLGHTEVFFLGGPHSLLRGLCT